MAGSLAQGDIALATLAHKVLTNAQGATTREAFVFLMYSYGVDEAPTTFPNEGLWCAVYVETNPTQWQMEQTPSEFFQSASLEDLFNALNTSLTPGTGGSVNLPFGGVAFLFFDGAAPTGSTTATTFLANMFAAAVDWVGTYGPSWQTQICFTWWPVSDQGQPAINQNNFYNNTLNYCFSPTQPNRLGTSGGSWNGLDGSGLSLQINPIGGNSDGTVSTNVSLENGAFIFTPFGTTDFSLYLQRNFSTDNSNNDQSILFGMLGNHGDKSPFSISVTGSNIGQISGSTSSLPTSNFNLPLSQNQSFCFNFEAPQRPGEWLPLWFAFSQGDTLLCDQCVGTSYSINILRPFDPSQTWFEIQAPEGGGSPMNSSFLNRQGTPLQVQSGKFTFSKIFGFSNAEGPYDAPFQIVGGLAPIGPFTFTDPDAADEPLVYVRPGFDAGTSIALPGSGTMHFVPDCPSAFTINNANGSYQFAPAVGNGQATSFCAICSDTDAPDTPAIFFSSAASTVPYVQDASGGSTLSAARLGVAIPPIAGIESATGPGDIPHGLFPMLPYQGMGPVSASDLPRGDGLLFDQDWTRTPIPAGFEAMENEYFAPMRTQSIEALLAGATTTPQQYIALDKELVTSAGYTAGQTIQSVDANGFVSSFALNDLYPNSTCIFTCDWNQLQIATFDGSATNTDSSINIGFSPATSESSLPTALRSAFMSGSQFSVISSTANLGTFAPTIQLDGWTFDQANAGTGSIGDYQNIVIFKSGHFAIEDMVAQPQLWTQREAFTDTGNDPNGYFLSQWLQNYIADAKDKLTNDNVTALQGFCDLVADPTWNGFLALKVSLDQTALPPDLVALTAGIDVSQLYGHHLGLDITHVEPSTTGSGLTQTSSMFGLVYYRDPHYAADVAILPDLPIADPYQFKLLELQAVFTGSQLQSFHSNSLLTINDVFGDAVVAGANGKVVNTLQFIGSSHRSGGAPVYTFKTENPEAFTLASDAFASMLIENATMSSQDSGSGSVCATFKMTGSFSFQTIQGTSAASGSPTMVPFDLLSFDALPFTGLALEMTVPTSGKDAVTYSLGPSGMSFPLPSRGVSNWAMDVRAGSLFDQLPLSIDGILTGNSTQLPSAMGYRPMTIGAPGSVPVPHIENDWIAVKFELDLGSGGILGKTHALSANLLLAWPAGANGGMAQVVPYFRLNGPGGVNLEFAFENVIKIGAEGVGLSYLPIGDPPKDCFVIGLENFGIDVLGMNFPPAGSTGVSLVGGLGTHPGSQLAWFAGYKRQASKTGSAQ